MRICPIRSRALCTSTPSLMLVRRSSPEPATSEQRHVLCVQKQTVPGDIAEILKDLFSKTCFAAGLCLRASPSL